MAALAHSIWLTLDAAAEARLRPVVDRLAAEYDRPTFQPHITFLGELDGDFEETVAAMEGLNWPEAPTARVKGVDWGGTFFTAVFLELDVPPVVYSLRESVAEELTGAEPKPYRPHASLAYGPIETRKKQRLIRGFEAEFADTVFGISEVAVVSSSTDTPVEDWNDLWRRTLRSE